MELAGTSLPDRPHASLPPPHWGASCWQLEISCSRSTVFTTGIGITTKQAFNCFVFPQRADYFAFTTPARAWMQEGDRNVTTLGAREVLKNQIVEEAMG